MECGIQSHLKSCSIFDMVSSVLLSMSLSSVVISLESSRQNQDDIAIGVTWLTALIGS